MKLTDLNVLLTDTSFKKDLSTGVWASGSQVFAYSDGDETENYILDTVRNTKDVSLASEELAEHIKDWASLYHFSHQRANLLAPFRSWFKGKRVLEIGCGCGAISRFLGEAGAQVVSVEGSLRRATITRARCKDLENVEVVCAPSNTLPHLGEFDAVLLIGVLEYARCFLGKDGQRILLQDCHKRLTENGHIFVAIENKLGIKYFAGAPEDHVGIPMHGINSAYTPDSVATFGRIELKELLSDSGFKTVEEYLPLPDYKLPCTIVTPLGWQNYSTELSTLALESACKDQQGIAHPIFSIEQGIKSTWINGLAADLSNSFMMIGAKDNKIGMHEGIAAYHYSDARASEYQKYLTIRENKNKELVVFSQQIFPEVLPRNNTDVCHNIKGEEDFIYGDNLFFELIKIINEENWSADEIAIWIEGWLSALISIACLSKNYNSETKIQGIYIDAMPFNAVKTSNEIKFFDLEWQLKDEVELGYIVYRALFLSLFRVTSVTKPKEGTPLNILDLVSTVMSRIGFALSDEKISHYIASEINLYHLMDANFDENEWAKQLRGKTFYSRIPIKEHQLCIVNQKSLIDSLQNEIDNQKNKIEEKDFHINQLQSDYSLISTQLNNQQVEIENTKTEIEVYKNNLLSNEKILKDQCDEWMRLCNQVDSLAKELQSVYRSKSWKVTKPVRFLSAKLKRISPLLLHPALLGEFFYIKLCKEFDGEKYLLANPDVRARHFNPLVHYLRYGRNENRLLFPVLGDNSVGVSKTDFEYVDWVQQNDSHSAYQISVMQNEIDNIQSKPLISVIMPTYNTLDWALKAAIDSVRNQIYPYWELCIADDASTESNVRKTLEQYQILDNRIKVVFRETNGHISAASNSALEMATGDYVVLLDHDDELSVNALYEFVKKIVEHPTVDLMYSDEDKIDAQGKRSLPFFKPDWSPHLAISQAYLGHLICMKSTLVREIGGWREGFEGAQDYDLWLRASLKSKHIMHIPKILYHWRMLDSSTAINPESKPYADTAGLRAVSDYLTTKYQDNLVEITGTAGEYLFTYRAHFAPDPSLKVSIIIPTRDKVTLLASCIKSIFEKSAWQNFEIIIIDNGSEEKETFDYFSHLNESFDNIKVIKADIPFNWSKLNNLGVVESTGDVLVFLNNDTIVISPEWLENLIGYARLPDVGLVGGLLLFEDGTIQHSGVVVGMNGWADHVYHAQACEHYGSPFVSPVLTRNVLAVTGACTAITRKKFESLGGYDEDFIICGSDVELCIRAHKRGLYNVICAEARLYHLESKTRTPHVPENDFVQSKKHYAPYRVDKVDPFYNENLSMNSKVPRVKNDLSILTEGDTEFYSGGMIMTSIPEIMPLNFRKSHLVLAKPRLNLLVPALSMKHVFGGIATALAFFECLIKDDVNVRIILTDEVDFNHKDNQKFAAWTILSLENADQNGRLIIPAGDRSNKMLAVARNDFFMSTAWWTALIVQKIAVWKKKHYSVEGEKSIYFIQDYEPGFYAWSSRYALAESTYHDPNMVAIFNTSLLKTFFDQEGYQFKDSFTFNPKINERLVELRDEYIRINKERQNTVLIYGRPNVDRNLFEIILLALNLWSQNNPNSQWKFLSAGEAYTDIDLGYGNTLHSLGKLTIDEYANVLASSKIGISLMLSPHPSYPPLEMSAYGLYVITNRYKNKELSCLSENIHSIPNLSPMVLAEALEGAMREVQVSPNIDLPDLTYFPFQEVGFLDIPEQVRHLICTDSINQYP